MSSPATFHGQAPKNHVLAGSAVKVKEGRMTGCPMMTMMDGGMGWMMGGMVLAGLLVVILLLLGIAALVKYLFTSRR